MKHSPVVMLASNAATSAASITNCRRSSLLRSSSTARCRSVMSWVTIVSPVTSPSSITGATTLANQRSSSGTRTSYEVVTRSATLRSNADRTSAWCSGVMKSSGVALPMKFSTSIPSAT